MNFDVLWTANAEAGLTSLRQNSDWGAILSAIVHLDTVLARDPHAHGESRVGSLRVAFEFPIGIEFEIDENRNEVYVLAVWHIRKTIS
jgi:hypothetical protein